MPQKFQFARAEGHGTFHHFSDIMQFRYIFFLFSTAFLTFSACKKEDQTAGQVTFVQPANFPSPVYDFSNNDITQAGFEVGRKLFYDPLLSRDSTIACADCHISFSAFSHPEHATSHGIGGQFGKRNAPAIQNMAWRTHFFWDGGVPNLDLVPLNAIQSAVEMDEKPGNIVRKLNRHRTYPSLFKKAFPALDTIDGPSMLKALSQFMNALVSANSRYDKYIRKEEGGTLNTQELAGLEVFKVKCASCHATDLFTDQTYRNNGILSDFSHDKGRAEVSALAEDIGKFSVPSLRNVEKTAPYMHNGKFKTLEAVLEHYASGIQNSPTLDGLLKQGNQFGIPLSATEKQQIIAFLKTLTDTDFLSDERFRGP